MLRFKWPFGLLPRLRGAQSTISVRGRTEEKGPPRLSLSRGACPERSRRVAGEVRLTARDAQGPRLQCCCGLRKKMDWLQPLVGVTLSPVDTRAGLAYLR